MVEMSLSLIFQSLRIIVLHSAYLVPSNYLFHSGNNTPSLIKYVKVW